MTRLNVWRRPACLDEDPDLFFPVETSGPVWEEQVREAQLVCAGCPVRAECAAAAMTSWSRTGEVVERPEQHGVWGGTTPEQRAEVAARSDRRRAASGRPAAEAGAAGVAA